MKIFIKILISLLLLLAGFIFYTFRTTGYFKTIENSFDGTIESRISLPGVEDLQISYASKFAILSSDDRAGRRDGNTNQGHLYYLDLNDGNAQPTQLTQGLDFPFFPHGISMIQTSNRAHKVFAVNHVGETHSIEVFDLFGDSLVHKKTLLHESMISPNDIVALDEQRFYFTNDHGSVSEKGKFVEDYLGIAKSNVVYFDGQNYRIVADKIAYANGINIKPEKQLLFVASPRSFLVKVYTVQENGDLKFAENIDCKTGVDNIEFGPDGKLWIGCHPNLLKFAAYAKGKTPYSPSHIITIDYQGKGDYEIETVFLDDGKNMSASTVAAPFRNKIYTGNVMDDEMLILKKASASPDFNWLLGKWNRTNDPEGKETKEYWTQNKEGIYKGLGYTLQQKDTVFLEHLMLIKSDGPWNLVVTGVNEQPTLFELTDVYENGFVCENQQNEFPKVIEYYISGSVLTAEISDGEMRIPFHFKKDID